MGISSRTIAILISVAVAVIILAGLVFGPYLPFRARVLTLAIAFSACFLLIYFSFEILIFKEINNIYAGLEHIKRKEFRKLSNKFLFRPDPLQRIKDEILFMAEQKQKEIDELKRLQVLRREFLADVSHELKTPIFAAQGFIHTLLDGAIDDETVRDKFLQKAAKSLDGLDALVQDLISISQLEKGVVKMNKHAMNMLTLCREVFDELDAKARIRKITLHLQHNGHQQIMVYADRNRIKQVLVNLVDNAVKYGSENGNIWVALLDGKRKVLVTVADDGPGIGKEHQHRIFERFYRIDKSRSRESGGSGLGLAISKHIIEAHRSTIIVSSELGKGTSLQFKLFKPKAKLPVT